MNKFVRNKKVSINGKLPVWGVLDRFKLMSPFLRTYARDRINNGMMMSENDEHFVEFISGAEQIPNITVAISKSPESSLSVNKAKKNNHLLLISTGYLLDAIERILLGVMEESENPGAYRKVGYNPFFWMIFDIIEYMNDSDCDIVEIKCSNREFKLLSGGSNYYSIYNQSWKADDFLALSASYERNAFRDRMVALYSDLLDGDSLSSIIHDEEFYKENMNIPKDVVMCEFMRVRGACG